MSLPPVNHTSNHGRLKKMHRVAKDYYLWHGLFWLCLLIIMIFSLNTIDGFFFKLIYSFINVSFYIAIVYFNFWYLIPMYLTRKLFLRYSILLLLAAIILTPIRMMILYIYFSGEPMLQASVIEEQYASFISTFLIGAGSTVYRILYDWSRHQRDRKDLETQTIHSELRFLKSQINPHFLFNTLNSLYALTLKKSDKAPEIVVKLSEMMRYMLYECNERLVPLYKEINYIKNYLELEKLRQGEEIEIHFHSEGIVTDQQIAPLIFIPFIENSFKHGLSKLLNEGFVHIWLSVEKKSVHLKIINSKPESVPLPNPKISGGIGLVNVKRRLNLIYPNNYTLDIEEDPTHYEINLSLTIKTD